MSRHALETFMVEWLTAVLPSSYAAKVMLRGFDPVPRGNVAAISRLVSSTRLGVVRETTDEEVMTVPDEGEPVGTGKFIQTRTSPMTYRLDVSFFGDDAEAMADLAAEAIYDATLGDARFDAAGIYLVGAQTRVMTEGRSVGSETWTVVEFTASTEVEREASVDVIEVLETEQGE